MLILLRKYHVLFRRDTYIIKINNHKKIIVISKINLNNCKEKNIYNKENKKRTKIKKQ